MSDDEVGCEWVSVSTGTGLPGLSRTKAVKRLCGTNNSMCMTRVTRTTCRNATGCSVLSTSDCGVGVRGLWFESHCGWLFRPSVL